MDTAHEMTGPDLPDWFVKTPVGRKLVEDDKNRIRQERRGTIAQIEKLKADRQRDAQALTEKLEQLKPGVAEASRVARELESAAGAVYDEKWSAERQFDHELGRLEAKLLDSASPEISEFIGQLQDLELATRRGLDVIERPGKKNPWTGKRKPVVTSNAFSIDERLAAIWRVRELAAQLRLAEPDDITAELDRLRESIPAIGPVVRTVAGEE